MTRKSKIPSYAKVNCGLWVGKKRRDGYHNICTIIVPLALHDIISLSTQSEHVSVTCTHPDVPTDESNLVYRAALCVRQAFPRKNKSKGVHIHIRKRIPVGSGLGGGSSNAAVILEHLPALWGCKLSQKKLIDIAVSLGADVPFFLLKKSAIGEGIGEKLTEIPFPIPPHIIVLYPGYPVSTGWAYRKVEPFRTQRSQRMNAMWIQKKLNSKIAVKDWCVNEFEYPVFQAYPALQDIKARWYKMGASFAGLSGSGSALFACFESRREAGRAAAHYRTQYQVFSTSLLDGC